MRTCLALAIVAVPLTAHAQAPDCNPATQACFDIRIDLPLVAEPNPRVGYERPTTNWYQGLELTIYRQLRTDRTPYTCTALSGDGGLAGEHGTDVDHIAALAEAHDSGLRADDMLTFSGDPANLTLATPHENRTRKGGRDAADYLPDHNRCWFAGRIVAVKQKWGLAVDARQAQFLKTAFAGCTPTQALTDVVLTRPPAVVGGAAVDVSP